MSDNTVWLALFPKPKQAQELAVPYGEKVKDIHLTLAFLGKYTDWDMSEKDTVQLISDIVHYREHTPEHGVVTGYGYFVEPRVFFAIPAVKDLLKFRTFLVDSLPSYDETYTYIPHMTLAKDAAGLGYSSTPHLTFDGVTVVYRGNKTLIPWNI